MANSSFETFKQGGQAIEETAKKTGEQANFKRSALIPVGMVLPVAGQWMTTVPIRTSSFTWREMAP